MRGGATGREVKEFGRVGGTGGSMEEGTDLEIPFSAQGETGECCCFGRSSEVSCGLTKASELVAWSRDWTFNALT